MATSIEPRALYRAGAIGAGIQLLGLAAIFAVTATLGPRPETAAAVFAAYQTGTPTLALRGDLLVVGLLIVPYLLTFPALYVALRRHAEGVAAFATLLTFIGVAAAIAAESTFSLLHLAGRFAAAAGEAERSALTAATEAVIASGLWNSTAGYAGGFLLQGPGVVVSLLMLRSERFHRVTAWSGLLANGLDLIQHTIHPIAPEISAAIAMVMGVFYIVWFPMLIRDFVRLARSPASASPSASDPAAVR